MIYIDLIFFQEVIKNKKFNFRLSLKDGIPTLNYGISTGIFFFNLQNIPPRNFYLKKSGRKFRDSGPEFRLLVKALILLKFFKSYIL
jgi:hypothetical protein